MICSSMQIFKTKTSFPIVSICGFCLINCFQVKVWTGVIKRLIWKCDPVDGKRSVTLARLFLGPNVHSRRPYVNRLPTLWKSNSGRASAWSNIRNRVAFWITSLSDQCYFILSAYRKYWAFECVYLFNLRVGRLLMKKIDQLLSFADIWGSTMMRFRGIDSPVPDRLSWWSSCSRVRARPARSSDRPSRIRPLCR